MTMTMTMPHGRFPFVPAAVVCCFVVVADKSPSTAQDSLQTSNATFLAPADALQKVATGYKFTEGPTADADGNVYFTDQPNDQILHHNFATGQTQVFAKPAGRSNGLYFDGRGRLIACADDKNELWAFDVQNKQHQVLVSPSDELSLTGPNDCWVDRDGTIYFTDPLYQRPWWPSKRDPKHRRGVYRISADGTVTKVIDDLKQPNGVVGDPELRSLFVADIDDGKVHRYRIGDEGSLTDSDVFCEAKCDGMTLDVERRLYVTNNEGVTVFDRQGQRVANVPVPSGWTANVCFAGPTGSTLVITATDSLYTLETLTRGLKFEPMQTSE